MYDDFADKLEAAIRDLKVGPGLEDNDIGPLIDGDGVEKVEEHVADAKDKGGKVVLGGARHDRGGLYFQPTLITGATQDMKFTKEETFGPVAGLIRFSSDEEGIALANETEFGLASYFYARDMTRVWHVMEALEAGMVGVNTGLISTAVAPFGGVKQSGLGREGSHYGIDEFMEIKYVCMAI